MQPRWRFEMNCYGWRCIPPHNNKHAGAKRPVLREL
jgi:hypothetical protein